MGEFFFLHPTAAAAFVRTKKARYAPKPEPDRPAIEDPEALAKAEAEVSELTCEECGKNFKSEQGLRLHMTRLHSEEEP